MTSGVPELEERLRAAMAEIDQAVAQARQDLARFERENRLTQEELQALHDSAARGELGFDMEEAARLVDEGRDTWAAIFSGESPNSVLLRGHLERMIDQNRDAVRTALEEDPDFDPFPPDQQL
ncbi:MAG TPA: hypothetical protein VGR06_15290 [Actinophytocola sp.]|jgi:hypothetical protein|uniref:hypothetical protein n=1 Tax=Actinophytocola sp. TaxID=1872138 RepID=UPI002E01998C|nr:hypothetical protein [Actinophytocola sp.]